MAVGIPAGTRISFQIVGATGSWVPRTVDTVRSGVISELSNSMTVNALNVTKVSGGFFSQYPLVFGYEANLIATTKYGHAKIQDVITFVNSAFRSAAGEYATISAPEYPGQLTQNPGTGDTTPPVLPGLLGVGSFTIIAAVAVAIFVAKRG